MEIIITTNFSNPQNVIISLDTCNFSIIRNGNKLIITEYMSFPCEINKYLSRVFSLNVDGINVNKDEKTVFEICSGFTL